MTPEQMMETIRDECIVTKEYDDDGEGGVAKHYVIEANESKLAERLNIKQPVTRNIYVLYRDSMTDVKYGILSAFTSEEDVIKEVEELNKDFPNEYSYKLITLFN